MGMNFRIYGSVESIPSMDEIIETLEESDFEITLENEDEDEDEWTQLMVYESSMAGPITLFRFVEGDDLPEAIEELMEAISENPDSDEGNQLLGILENCTIGYGVDLSDELVEDDNAIVLSQLLAQYLAQKCDGIYVVDEAGFFNETGDLIYEALVEEEEE